MNFKTESFYLNIMEIKNIIEKVRIKKFRNLDEEAVKHKINEFLKRNPKIRLNELKEKSSDLKKIIKYVKKEMHHSYGAFQNDISKRERLLDELKRTNSMSDDFIELHKKILSTHKSTKERLMIYDKLYEAIFSIIGRPESILDIGCGLNPFSLPWMGLNKLTYIASEFNNEDNRFISEYFNFISGLYQNYELKTLRIDLNKDFDKLKGIKVDAVFCWKVFDLLDFKKTENIVKSLNAKWLVASFSTKTLGNRKMNSPRRAGFQKMLRRLNLEYKTLSYENEIFYVVKL